MADETLAKFRDAARRKDFGSALALWRTLDGASATDDDRLLAAKSARAFGDLDQAETLVDGLRRSAPDDPATAIEHAAIATDRRDWPQAIRRWRVARELSPETSGAWFNYGWALQLAGVLDEAGTVLTRAYEQFPNDERIVVALARNAAMRGDVARSLKLWSLAAASFPNRPQIHLHRVMALRDAGDPATAEVAYAEAVAVCTPSIPLLVEGAGLAHTAADWVTAAARWRGVLAVEPTHRAAGAKLIEALRQSGGPEAADAAFEAVAATRPTPWAEWAFWAGNAAGDPAETVRRWRAVAAALPERVEPLRAALAAARALGDDAMVAELIADGAARFPTDAALMGAHAEAAVAAGDLATALARFGAIDPMDDDARVGLLGVLLTLDRLDAAQAVWYDLSPVYETRDAVERAARLGTRRLDFDEAERRWDLAATLFPADPGIADQRRAFRRLIGLEWVDEPAATAIDVARLALSLV